VTIYFINMLFEKAFTSDTGSVSYDVDEEDGLERLLSESNSNDNTPKGMDHGLLHWNWNIFDLTCRHSVT
jgi:hypothetical protein